MSTLAFLVTAVLVPMLVNEFTDWLPWFAARLIGVAARTLPSDVRPRYAEEWLAELDAVPGNLSKLALAIRIFAGAPGTAAALGGLPSLKAVAVKALFDKALAGVMLVLLAPLFAIVMLAIKLDDHGPVFFRQVRVGKDGHTFSLWKFRTMVVDAEQRKAELTALNEGAGVLFKMRSDPQLTKAGSWLRRYSLDELPQLFNLLAGDMSLVGPRPVLPAEAGRYADHRRRRLMVKPGITGLWQVNGRSDLTWDEAVWLDLRYVDNWSLALDLQILWRTWAAAVKGTVPADLVTKARPDWWDFPLRCENGHPWWPDSVRVSWTTCECLSARSAYTDGPPGHLAVHCGYRGCQSVWYRPRHEPGSTQVR